MLRFRRFRSRVLALLLGVLFATLAVTYTFVSRANQRSALAQIHADLEVGARTFDTAARQRIDLLALGANAMVGDYAIRTVLLSEQPDTETLADILESYTQRIGVPVIGLFNRDGRLVASSGSALTAEKAAPLSNLIRDAAAKNEARLSAFAYLDRALHSLVVVPLYAPFPNIEGWFGLAFPIDETFAENVKATSRVDVTFVSTEGDSHPRVLASTLVPASADRVAQAAAASAPSRARPAMVTLEDDQYVTLFKVQEMLGTSPIQVVLQRPLSPELAVARALEDVLLLTSLAALALATAAAFWVAQGVSQPVQQLAEYTRYVATGDYTQRLAVNRVDEFGHLAESFNQMSAGLAERARVRDLLDKNVSPEVAAALLRDGATLGGQEREVTILFADLRNFTTLSESIAPRELVTLLNRYLDRMSAEIERHGGVIDKFIGDAIMALFGAPVAQGDAADRAIASALAMERALAELNVELAAEGRAPFGIGVGINTARVVAGNIGSHRRLNYSVIGDGVNVAARLQAQTRTPEYRTNIIVSAATIAAVRNRDRVSARALGTVHVKGRTADVEIFAVS